MKVKQKKTKSVLHAGMHRVCAQKMWSKYTQKIMVSTVSLRLRAVAAVVIIMLNIRCWS